MATKPVKRTLTQTDAFKSWFDGSKLADQEGNPLILYHGTRPGNDPIDEFESRHETDGIYFTPDPLYAEGFASELFGDDLGDGPIYPVYLSIKNPFVVTADEQDEDWGLFVDRGFDRTELLAQGYDGAILVEKSTGIIDQVQAYHPNQIKSAIGNSGSFDPTIPDIRYSRNDPRYLFAGPQAESSDLSMLDKARQMEKGKASEAMIYNDTGWYRGVDGQWRFEISDHEAKLKIGIPKDVEEDVIARVDREVIYETEGKGVRAKYRPDGRDYLGTGGYTIEDARANVIRHLIKREYPGFRSLEQVKGQPVELSELLDHPRLFAAYPRLKEMMVFLDPNMSDNLKGEFSWGQGITLNANRSETDILSTLLHEVQHAVQEGEGFAQGGMPEQYFAGQVKGLLSNLDSSARENINQWVTDNQDLINAQRDASDLLTYGLMFQSFRRLREHANRDRPSGVLRLIKNEMSWVYHDKVREDENLRRQFDELDRDWYSLPKRHQMAKRNSFLRNQCDQAANLLRQVIPKEAFDSFRNDERKLNSMIKALEREASRARAKLKPLSELERQEKITSGLKERHSFSGPYEIYRSLAGEIEARNTQARQNMTPEERRATPPERTADMPRGDAIVIMGGRYNSTVTIPHRSASASAPGYLRQAEPTFGKMTVENAQYICNSLMHGWAGRPDIQVVDRLSQLPAPLRKDIWDKRAIHDVRAAFWNDTAYLVAPRLPSRDALEETLLHEVVGHFGLRTMLADQLNPTLSQVYTDYGDSELADEIRGLYFKDQPFNPDNESHRLLVAEEMMAKLAESQEHRALSLWDRFDSQTRDGLREMGYQIRMTSEDLVNLLHGAERTLQSGGLARPSEFDTRFRRAYHGSPYRFDRFSLDAIGSGEGAQAYGWGLYFAGRQGIADYYRQTVTSRVNLNEVARNHGIEVPDEATRAAIFRLSMAREYDSTQAAKRVHWQSRVARNLPLTNIEALIEDLRAQYDGNLYEVDIPDDSQLLDRDARLSEQPDAVKDALRNVQFPLTGSDAYAYQAGFGIDPFAGGVINEPTGADLQAAIARAADQQTFDRKGPIWELVKDDPNRLNYNLSQLTSMYLHSLGIPGLRYRDAGSRTREAEATYNYVIWDENAVSIEVVNEELLQAKQEARFKLAYHGSPHQFDQFSLSAIGTGEGVQAFGWGLYFAGSQQIADWYRKTLAEDTDDSLFYVDDKPIDYGEDIALRTALYQAEEVGPEKALENAVAMAQRLADRGEALEPITVRTMDALRSLQGHKITLIAGSLYQVEIPADYDLLDWGLPLSKQPAAIVRALGQSKLLERLGFESWEAAASQLDGQGLYGAVKQWLVDNDEPWTELGKTPHDVLNVDQAASEYLNRIGIPGLRYLDRPSRHQGQGDYNYVIWDESAVSIAAVNEEIRQAEQKETFRYRVSQDGQRQSSFDKSTWVSFNGQRLSIDQAQSRASELAESVTAAYEAGDLDRATKLDVELESLYDSLEHALAAVEEDGLNQQYNNASERELAKASWATFSGSAEDAETGLLEALASTYRDYIDVHHWLDREALVANGRANIESFGGDTSNVSDNKIIEAMRDAHDSTGARGAQLRHKNDRPFGIDPLKTDAWRTRESLLAYTPFIEPADYEIATELLNSMDTDDLIAMLREEAGVEAADLPKESLVAAAYDHGLHKIQNSFYNGLIQAAVTRFGDGRDTAKEAAITIDIAMRKGAYGYDLHAVEPILREATGQRVRQPAQSEIKTDIPVPAPDLTPEGRFRSFLYQELGFQESCLLMAEVCDDGDEIGSRRRAEHHRQEIQDLQLNLSMLDAGMTVQEIRQQATPSKPEPEATRPQVPRQVLSLTERLKLNQAQKKASGGPDDDNGAQPGPR